MNRVQILDCTLRDGGYCNQWLFGTENIKSIIGSLTKAKIDIVECGFLNHYIEYNKAQSKYSSIEQLEEILSLDVYNRMYVVMGNYGEIDINKIPNYSGGKVSGVRVAFHKKDMLAALALCEDIKAKGYNVFVQAMVSLNYSDEEFIDLIKRVNGFGPYAFYIVDSFGVMNGTNLTRLYYLVEHNLNSDIKIGFHSHNNMQLAYSNAQLLAGIQTSREIIVDSSIMGMGRGAGNLNTELFVQYLNEGFAGEYILEPVLQVIDSVIDLFYQKSSWGYSLPNYLSAKHGAHPNYAKYFDDKKTLTVENMNEIFGMMDYERKISYDKNYAEKIYLSYMINRKGQECQLSAEITKKFQGKRVLLIAPGKSVEEEKAKVIARAKEDVIVVSVNFDYKACDVNYVFISNNRRFRELDNKKQDKLIVTSNIEDEGKFLVVDYQSLLSDVESVEDNAGMMAIKFLIKAGVAEVILAGFDGYSYDVYENYADQQMHIMAKRENIDSINYGIKMLLDGYAKEVKLTFLTSSRYQEKE